MSIFSINASPGYPFQATPGKGTGAIATTTTSASASLGVNGDTVLIANNSTTWAFVTFTKGTVAVVKPTAGNPQDGVYPIPPNAMQTISLKTGQDGKSQFPADTINAVSDTGTGTIYFVTGTGS
jgi:hypothetical protein